MNDGPSRHDVVYRLTKIADASKREDGTDIPLGMEIRRGIAEIERLRAELTKQKEAIDPFDFEYTAFKAGVKAGLEAAKVVTRQVMEELFGEEANRYRPATAFSGALARYASDICYRVSKIDPATITREGG